MYQQNEITMRTIDKTINFKGEYFDFAEFYYEHNGRKFKVHYEGTSSMPCASIGHDWYQSLSVMKEDGTWEQVTDAKVVGAPTHYELHYKRAAEARALLAEADKKFQSYIKKIY